MPNLADVNWIAAVVAAVLYFALGALWYGPLFGKRWVAGMGLDKESMAPATSGFVITFVANLVVAITVAAFVANAADVMSALTTAWWLWLGFTAATMAVNATWDTRPWSVFAINASHHLVGMSVAAAVVAAWPS